MIPWAIYLTGNAYTYSDALLKVAFISRDDNRIRDRQITISHPKFIASASCDPPRINLNNTAH